MIQNKLYAVLCLSIFSVYAANQNVIVVAPPLKNGTEASAPTSNIVAPQSAPTLNVTSSTLQDVDNDWNTQNSINRKLKIKQDEKALNSSSGNNDKNTDEIRGQTIATNIVIVTNGFKSATLQFVDGSTYDVQPGTKIGKFTVSDITMNGVELSYSTCNKTKCAHTKMIKRGYPIARSNSSTGNNVPIQSSPTMVMNPNYQSDEQIPPLSNKVPGI